MKETNCDAPDNLLPVDEWRLKESTLLQYFSTDKLEAAADLVNLGHVDHTLAFERELLGDVTGPWGRVRCHVCFDGDRPRFECSCSGPQRCVHGLAVLLLFLREPASFTRWGRVEDLLQIMPEQFLIALVDRLLRSDEPRSVVEEFVGEKAGIEDSFLAAARVLVAGLAEEGPGVRPGSQRVRGALELLSESMQAEQSPEAVLRLFGHLVQETDPEGENLFWEWAESNLRVDLLLSVPRSRQAVLLRELLQRAALNHRARELLYGWYTSNAADPAWAELWNSTLLGLVRAVRAQLVWVESEGGRSTSTTSVTELAEQERGITALLGRIQLFERRIEAHRKSLVARMRWFTRFCPEVAGAEARWTAERLDAVGAHDKAVEVLQWALSTAPGARGSAGTCEIPLLRSELADRLAVQGRHDEELAHRVSNFEEDPTWPSYRRVCEVLQELGGLDTDCAKRLLRQLPNIALSFSRTNLALRIALDLEQQQRIQAIVRDAGVEELDKLLLARAVEYISKFEPETALRLLRPRVRPLMQEKRRAEEIEEGVARLARLLRGLTSSVEGWEAWADYMQDLESEVGEPRKWWRQLNLWE